MSAQQAAWDDLPLGVQQRILVLTGSPCARRVSKGWRDAFDTANDTLCFSHSSDQSLKVAATVAAMRVVRNSASLTAVDLMKPWNYKPPPLMLSDLLAAGAASGLATRLQTLTGIRVTAACAGQQLQTLRQCTGLTHLDISGSISQDCVAVELAAALQAMPRLTYLNMRSCEAQSQGAVSTLASVLQSLTQLQHLQLAESCLRGAGLAALAPALSAMPGLQTLDVSKGLLAGAAGAKALCTVLGAVPGLTHLDVSHSPLKVEGAPLLAAVLRGMTRLQTLNMSYTDIGDDGLALLAPALAALPHLHALNLRDNELGLSAASMLQPVLAREGSPLHKLDLSWNAFKMGGAHALVSALSTAPQLLELNLIHTAMGDEGWVALAPCLGRLGPSLQSLQLGVESMDNAVSAALASALQALTALTRLQAVKFFRSEAMATISPALMGMRRLQVLDLSVNIMRSEGTAALAAVLPALAGSLKHLAVSACGVPVQAAADALAPALALVTGLIELQLDCNDFGPPGAQWLVPVLSGLPHLRKVDLHSCELGVQGCMAVAHALKDRDSVYVNLRCNGVIIGSAEGFKLRNMPGIRVHL